ncbi:uncharacterized protein BX664DRAFT_378375 [Halteromyces radiatus]|uniref:uncharacterized protein n=1 Tax=Halteromyces radiatus TaxID=101107 RepID=UPI00221E8F2B|nr:uncharacterized protein BX664DRAFT_378375 [Halteromyces radiatus]KAI8092460.1 hypothetical protein BX664DRAFT_378375 [Halteromyces radiatus]
MEDVHSQVKELQAKIQHNTQLLEKAIQLRSMLTDQNAQQQCDTQIKEAQRYIDYFTNELQKLQHKITRSSTQSSVSSQVPPTSDDANDMSSQENYQWLSMPSETGSSSTTSPITPSPTLTQSPNSAFFPSLDGLVGETNNNNNNNNNSTDNTSVLLDSSLSVNDSHYRKKYTNLDLLKADTPINRAKVSLKLHDLEYKVDVEKKVQMGIKNLSQTYNPHSSATTERRIKSEIQEKQAESNEKMSLLTTAVRKYKDLYLGEEEDVDSTDDIKSMTAEEILENGSNSRAPAGMRRPVTGKLQLKIIEAKDLAHAPTRMFRIRQTVVMVKIDGSTQCRTRSSKVDKWTDAFEMHVDKATELELLVYDQSGERTLPIGLLWLKISDITESLRKQKVDQDQQDTNWVSADVAQQHRDPTCSIAVDSTLSVDKSNNNNNNSSNNNNNNSDHLPNNSLKNSDMTLQPSSDGIHAWFDVEPVGRIYLHINFVREAGNRRPMDKLGRAGAVRERKGEVHELNGHQFVTRRFYHIMKCALCGDFMTNLTYQCEDCGMACHKKCFANVVTKCVSRKQSASQDDADALRHRIPHRFEWLTIIGAHWCCHCGSMLSLGFRGAQKCCECDIVCHTRCAHLIPDFCGMTMETANLMLSEMRAANNRRSQLIDLPRNSTTVSGQLQIQGQPIREDSFYNNSLASVGEVSLPTSLSAMPPRSNTAQGRPFSATFDSSSYQSISALFGNSEASLNKRFSQPLVARKTTPVQLSRRVGLDDFNLLAVLGKGNFGKVMLAEEKYTNELYAIKVLKKRFVLDNDEVDSTRSEKRVFLVANQERHPFLVSLHSTFQTETRIYFVMEYISGGDLMMHIQREQFSEKRARFYACEVLLALEHFHKHGIIYRDLKLDNIMLCLDGHIKLADYGLCKENIFHNNTTNTFCGTPEFMAPEILLEQRYGRAVDWWAFGVLIYEMLLGQSPFKGEDEDEIFDAVLEDEILYPITMSRNCVSICQKLLERNPARRLGSSKSDGHEVRQHVFFSGINWDDVLAKKVPPPFLPTVAGRADTSNFDEEFTREIPILTPVNAMLTQLEQQEFTGFSYVANWAIDS